MTAARHVAGRAGLGAAPPALLREAGVEFVLLDDSHFALAGLEPETLGGYYLTEEQGATLAVFPISQRLRYLVPFAEPAETVRYLASRRGAGAVTLVDDGEKFGVWPGTHRLVYDERWLARFLEALRATPWLRVSTFSRFLDTEPAAGRVYLPTASYTEMGEWALPPAAAAELHDARARLAALPDGERLSRLLRGGFWRNFLVKYPEIGDAYWKMLRLSRRVHEGLAARPRDPRLLAARERLWQGQANDAYWHGVFGGCYLPHLRRAVKSALIGCERRLDGPGQAAGARLRARRHRRRRGGRGGRAHALARADPAPGPRRLAHRAALARRGDGRRGRAHAAPRAVSPAGGGAAVGGRGGRGEDDPLGSRGQGRGADRAAPLRSLPPRLAARRALRAGGRARSARSVGRGAAGGGRAAPEHEVKTSPREVALLCSVQRPDGLPLAVEKSVVAMADGAAVTVTYRLRWEGEEALVARWAVQLNLALSAGDAPGRYYRVPGRPSLGSRGRLPAVRGLAMVDEWLGCALELRWANPADIAWAPVETVSLSETGFERIYQGSALLFAWPLRLQPGQTWETSLRVAIGETVTP